MKRHDGEDENNFHSARLVAKTAVEDEEDIAGRCQTNTVESYKHVRNHCFLHDAGISPGIAGCEAGVGVGVQGKRMKYLIG